MNHLTEYVFRKKKKNENLNLLVFDMITEINESQTLTYIMWM